MSIKLINRRVVLQNSLGMLWALPLASLLKSQRAFGVVPTKNFKYLVLIHGGHHWGDLSAFLPGIRPWRPWFSDNPLSPIGGDQDVGITRDPSGVRYWSLPGPSNLWGAWQYVDPTLYAAYKNRTTFLAGLSPATTSADAHRLSTRCAIHWTGNYHTDVSSVSIDSMFATMGVTNGLINNTEYPVYILGRGTNTVPYGSNVPVGSSAGDMANDSYVNGFDNGVRISANQASGGNFQNRQAGRFSVIDLFRAELNDLKNSGLIASVPDLQAYLETVRFIESSAQGAQNPIPNMCTHPSAPLTDHPMYRGSNNYMQSDWSNNIQMASALLSCGLTHCVSINTAEPNFASVDSAIGYGDLYNATAGFGQRMNALYASDPKWGADFNSFVSFINSNTTAPDFHKSFHNSGASIAPAYQMNAAFVNQGYQLMDVLNQIQDTQYGGTIGSNTAIVMVREAGLCSDVHSSNLAAMVIGGDENKMLNAGYIYDYLDYDVAKQIRTPPSTGSAYTYNHFLVSILQSMGLNPADYNPTGQTGFGTYMSDTFTSVQGLTNSPIIPYGTAPVIPLVSADPTRRDELLPKAFRKV